MKIAGSWTYPGGDSCADFFTRYLNAANPDIPANANVLEIGCEEFDWLGPAKQCWPEMSLTGIDWRTSGRFDKDGYVKRHGDARNLGLFAPESFDLIVSISAIEHIGLGHYKQDPIDLDGDIAAMANAFKWLKPGGWLLFDVPYDPTGYKKLRTECRVYDDSALWDRLWCEPLVRAKATAAWRTTVYAHAKNTGVLIEKPTEPADPFYYVGLGWQKCEKHTDGCWCLACG